MPWHRFGGAQPGTGSARLGTAAPSPCSSRCVAQGQGERVNHTLSLPPAAARQLGRSPLANVPQLALALERQRVREQRAQRDEAHRSLLGPVGCQGARDTGTPR